MELELKVFTRKLAIPAIRWASSSIFVALSSYGFHAASCRMTHRRICSFLDRKVAMIFMNKVQSQVAIRLRQYCLLLRKMLWRTACDACLSISGVASRADPWLGARPAM